MSHAPMIADGRRTGCKRVGPGRRRALVGRWVGLPGRRRRIDPPPPRSDRPVNGPGGSSGPEARPKPGPGVTRSNAKPGPAPRLPNRGVLREWCP
jgi:hypothetical protein